MPTHKSVLLRTARSPQRPASKTGSEETLWAIFCEIRKYELTLKPMGLLQNVRASVNLAHQSSARRIVEGGSPQTFLHKVPPTRVCAEPGVTGRALTQNDAGE